MELWRSGLRGSLATLVRVEGSSYREPGARLLVVADAPGTAADERYAGTISGGCLEADIVRKSHWRTRRGATIERYAMAFDDTAEIPFGLGCGGTVDVLFESLQTPEAEALMQALADSLEGVEASVVTFLPQNSRPLRRVVFVEGWARFVSTLVTAEEMHLAQKVIADDLVSCPDDLFVERLEVPQRLFLLGAGDDAKPVVTVAELLGWSVFVVDERKQLATVERFPGARLIHRSGDAALRDLGGGQKDAAIVMSHSYEQDRKHLQALLPRQLCYVGLLGSRHRSGVLVAETAAMLGWTLDECCVNVFAPVGLDIGGEGPEAIALSIIAEIQSVRHGKLGSGRRLRSTDVLLQLERGGASQYLQARCALSEG